MFPSLAARETYVAETHYAARKQDHVFASGQKHVCSRTQILLPKHVFPSLATMKEINWLVEEVEEPQACHRKGKAWKESNWKDEKIELLITLYEDRACLWDVAHEDCMNRDKNEVAYC